MKVAVHGVEFDLELAVTRLKADLQDDWFPDPVRFADQLTHLDSLKSAFGENYEPSAATDVNVPKPGFTVRYSLEQDIRDRVLYQGVANELQHLDVFLGPEVYGYRIRAATGREMFKARVQNWLEFNATVRVRLKEAGGVLLAADIQNYYEAIQHDRLVGDIQRLDPQSGPVAELLKKLLAKWCHGGGGLPQNRDASSFLANLYLESIDKRMLDRNYTYLRYMDDIRVLCSDMYHARRALMDLITELRERGLSVNALKTKMIPADSPQLDDFAPPPDGNVERFDAMVSTGRATAVIPAMISQLESLLAADQLESRAFRAALERTRRIVASRYREAVSLGKVTEGLVRCLTDYPWHTDRVVALLRHIPLTPDQVDALAMIVVEPERFPYAWQAYHVWQLLAAQGARRDVLRRSALRQSSLAAAEDAVRAAGAILYLGACGEGHDRARLASQISQYPPHRLVRRAIVIATQEVGTFYADRYLSDLTVDEAQLRTHLTSQPKPTYVADAPRMSLSRFSADLRDEY